MAQPRVLVVPAPGTNCDEETAYAWRLAGAAVESWHIGRLLERPGGLDAFQILTIPGGFSYGDDLGAGRIFAARLASLADDLRRFHERGGLVLGICNGFQVLVKAGLLPGGGARATLTHNETGRHETRWVRLGPDARRCVFVRDHEPIALPVSHGEGKFLIDPPAALDRLVATGQVVFRYVDAEGLPTERFPENPNGSPGGVAGVCDPSGRILGLMPHPERHVDALQHPQWTRRGPRPEGDGLRLFRNAVESVR